MKAVELNTIYSVEEYILLEEASEVRHEFINGNLIEMSGASGEHHFICKRFLRLLEDLLRGTNYEVFMENMKVKIENENQYYYPDIFITRETQTDKNKFIQSQPELIIEVLSDSTRTKDLVDKFIQYRKISSLNYYLIVEAEKCLLLCYEKDEQGEWDMVSYTMINEILSLPKLNIKISLNQIYS